MEPRKFINAKFFTRIIFNVKISRSTVTVGKIMTLKKLTLCTSKSSTIHVAPAEDSLANSIMVAID